jgi:ABC-type glycerol-3-phosphate transport system substrate-binding protein
MTIRLPHPLAFRRTALRDAILLLAALALPACATPSTANSPTASSSEQVPAAGTLTPTPTALPSIDVDAAVLRGVTIQVWHAFAGPAYQIFTSQVAQFNAINEWGISVLPAAYADYGSLSDAVDTALISGESPDLVAALPEQTLGWDVDGRVVDLNPYIGDLNWGLGADALAEIPAPFFAQDNSGGKQLGVPAQRSTRLIFYNETWAHELGFNTPPQTTDEFRQQACAANAAFRTDASARNDGYGGWVVDADWQTSYSWLLAFGGQVQDGAAYRFRDDRNLGALRFLKGLYDDACAWVSTEPNPFDAFAGRKALFVSGDLAQVPYAAGAMSRAGNADIWTVIPFPGSQGGVLVAYGPSYSVLRSTPERQLAAWLFARWLLSAENQAQWVEATNLLPLRTSLLDMIGPYRTTYPQWDAAVADLPQARIVPQLASWRKVRYVLEDGMTVIFRTNTPVDQLASVLADMDSMAEELNK